MVSESLLNLNKISEGKVIGLIIGKNRVEVYLDEIQDLVDDLVEVNMGVFRCDEADIYKEYLNKYIDFCLLVNQYKRNHGMKIF